MNLNMLYETVRQALKNIASNKFRTLLTMLGIIIGIMAGVYSSAAIIYLFGKKKNAALVTF